MPLKLSRPLFLCCCVFTVKSIIAFQSFLRKTKIQTPCLYSNSDEDENRIDRDVQWKNEANKIEYVSASPTHFTSLGEIGLTVSPNTGFRSIIPYHVTTGSDLFCNRELDISQTEAIGFDMDWTLSQYTEAFDLLAYDGAKDKLVEMLGYPVDVYNYSYSQNMYRRSCIIDKKRGNILKLDRHKYVRVAEHGLTPLTSDERHSIYRNSHDEKQEIAGSGFANIDTPFSLVDACLFSQVVDLKDKLDSSNELLRRKSYLQLWLDIRKCVDKCHNDGVIKLAVAKNPSLYIEYDPNLFPMLNGFREAGIKVFLLTNSLWDYTQVVMNYLEGRKDANNRDLKWAESFDFVIVGGNKPSFLLDEKQSLSLKRLDPNSHALKNVDSLPSGAAKLQEFLQEGKFFQGGNAEVLLKLLQIKSGERLLYVGDHIYSDILRSKRTRGWRTCLIIPELTQELKTNKQKRKERNELAELRRNQFRLEDQIDGILQQIWQIKRAAQSAPNVGSEHDRILELEEQAKTLEEEKQRLRDHIRVRLEELDAAYHPRWGPMFKAGFQESRFATQVMDFACVYTSRASNLGLVSPHRPFRPTRDKMAHDYSLEDDLQSKREIFNQ